MKPYIKPSIKSHNMYKSDLGGPCCAGCCEIDPGQVD